MLRISPSFPIWKKILNAIEGISIATPKKTRKKSGIEQSYEDLQAGRVTHYKDSEEMFKAFGIWAIL